MKEVKANKFTTIEISEATCVDFCGASFWVDIANVTDGSIKISNEPIGENNYLLIPQKSSYSGYYAAGGRLYIEPEVSGVVTMAAR